MGTIMKPLPSAIEQFVTAQKTIAVAELCKDDGEAEVSPYGSCWYCAVAAMLCSGRVSAKMNGQPNRTDLNRICKEANFNQHLFERIATFLVAAKVIQADRRGRYAKGPNHLAFRKHRRKELTEITHTAVLDLVQGNSGSLPWRPTLAIHSSLIEFLIIFFYCFDRRALRKDQVGPMMLDFSRLPETDLKSVAVDAGIRNGQMRRFDWEPWLDERGQRALLSALYTAEWLYYDEWQGVGWVFPSPIGLGLLGLRQLPEAPTLAKALKSDSNLAIYAGAGLELDTLATLLRCCKIKRIDQLVELQVDPKVLKATPSASPALRATLADLEPLPSSLAAILQTESPLGGKIGIRYCSALVKPATPEAVAAIRQHPQLKGYLEPGAPPGFLLIKPGSNPGNFIRRCQALGFEIESL